MSSADPIAVQALPLALLRHVPSRKPRAYSLPCEAPGCGEGTAEGKPYCLAHVLMHPYASSVRQGLEQLADDDVDAVRAEILRALVDGPQSIARLAVSVGCGVSQDVVAAALEQLRRQGLVRGCAGRRGTWALRLRGCG